MKKHGCAWWLCIGWWWLPVKLVFYSIPAFVIRKAIKSAKTQAAPQPVTRPATRPPNTGTGIQKQPTAPQTTQSPVPGNVKTYRAVGMNYRMDDLLSLGVKNEEYHKSGKYLAENGLLEQNIYEYDFYPLKAELVPEPDNPHDPNAIKVVVDGVHVAYIKAGSCAHLLKVIRENRVKKIVCKIRGGKYKYVACECDEDGNEEYTIDKDERPYTVTLYVTEE